MKLPLKVLSVFLVCFFIFFFISKFKKEEIQDNRQVIRLWQFWPERWIQPIIGQFELENPDIKVKIERLTWADGLNKVITAMAANQAPDVVELGTTWVSGFSEDGGLRALNVEDLKNNLTHWEPAVYNGNTYAIPWTLSTGALYYNQELLDKAGIKRLPENWEELYLASKKITDLGEEFYGFGLKTGAYSTWHKFLPFAWSNGGRIFDPVTNKARLAESAFIQAVQFYKKLKTVGLYDENTAIRKAFKEGKMGFMIEEPGQIRIFKKEAPELKFGIMALPAAPATGKSIGFAGGQMLAVTKNTKNQAAAEKLIRFLVKLKSVKVITNRITTLFPAHKNIEQDSFYQQQHPELIPFLNILKTATHPYSHPRWIDIQEEFTQELDLVMYERLSPTEAMLDAQKQIDFILSERQ